MNYPENSSAYRVAHAWKQGERASGNNVSTDGRDVYSYGHKVGTTANDGQKIAYDCAYSATTSKQCAAFKAVADAVVACPDRHWSQRIEREVRAGRMAIG